MEQQLFIQGMTCQNCREGVMGKLNSIEGVFEAEVSLETGKVILKVDNQIPLNYLSEILGKKYQISNFEKMSSEADQQVESKLKALFPLFLIFGFIMDATILIHWPVWNMTAMMHDFMGMFFMVFSFFKLLDLKGFQASFKMYDPMAVVWHAYGLIYPFLELALGVCYIRDFVPDGVLWITIIVLGITTVGVVKTLLKKRSIQCACLGSVLKLPMTEATFIENAIMIVMAASLLL